MVPVKPKTVGIRVLKDRLSAYVRGIAGDGEVLITDRGRAVARLVSLDASTAAPRGPLRVRHAVKNLSDLEWMAPGRKAAASAEDLASALERTRRDHEPR